MAINDAGADDLGPLLRSFPSLSLWHSTSGLIAAAAMMALGGALVFVGHGAGDPDVLGAGAAILGLVVLAALWIRREQRAVDVHRGGLVLRSRKGARPLYWDELARIEMTFALRDRRGRHPDLCITLVREGGVTERFAIGASPEHDALAMLIERTSAPVMAAKLAAALDAGAVAIVGQLHLRRSGWVVMNETLPWHDLESLDADDGTVTAIFRSAGLHEVGTYKDIAVAQAHLHLAVERARAGGGQPTVSPGLLLGAGDVADDPAAKGARMAPGRVAWRAARGGTRRRWW